MRSGRSRQLGISVGVGYDSTDGICDDFSVGTEEVIDGGGDWGATLVPSQMTLEAVINAEMKRRCPEEPRAAMTTKVNEDVIPVWWRVYAMKYAREGEDEGGGWSRQWPEVKVDWWRAVLTAR